MRTRCHPGVAPRPGATRVIDPEWATVPSVNTTRRQLLQWFGAMSLASLPLGCVPNVTSEPTWRFLTPAEASLWAALADAIWPPGDTTPGGATLGASRYLDRLLSAFDSDAPLFYADAEGRSPIVLDARGCSPRRVGGASTTSSS